MYGRASPAVILDVHSPISVIIELNLAGADFWRSATVLTPFFVDFMRPVTMQSSL